MTERDLNHENDVVNESENSYIENLQFWVGFFLELARQQDASYEKCGCHHCKKRIGKTPAMEKAVYYSDLVNAEMDRIYTGPSETDEDGRPMNVAVYVKKKTKKK